MTMTFHQVSVDMVVVMFHIRAHNRVMNDCHRETMEYTRDIYGPQHFRTDAFTRYPGIFRIRSRKWQILKARVMGHQRPNVWTGALRLSMTESICRATATRGTLEAKAPLDTVIQFGKNKGKRIRRPLNPERRLEMEHVSTDEIVEQCDRMRNQYVAAAYDPKWQTKLLKRFR